MTQFYTAIWNARFPSRGVARAMISTPRRSSCFPGFFMRIGLFVTCLVDLMRPSIGLAALKLLENAGYEVKVPAMQTCCGQPGWNSGDRESTRALAERL